MKFRLAELPERVASFIEPMECLAVSKLPEGPQWTYEIKLDGYRAIAVKSGSTLSLRSRRNKPFNDQYPHLIDPLRNLPDDSVVDGEVVALDDAGAPSFNLLQAFRKQASRIHYFIFDLLICQGRNLTKLPLVERRELLEQFVTPGSPRIRIVDQFDVPAEWPVYEELAAKTCNLAGPLLWTKFVVSLAGEAYDARERGLIGNSGLEVSA